MRALRLRLVMTTVSDLVLPRRDRPSSPDEPTTVPEVVWRVRAFEDEAEDEAEHRDFSRLVFPVTVVRGGLESGRPIQTFAGYKLFVTAGMAIP